jgi:multiple sugar transport system substrate-binding protein
MKRKSLWILAVALLVVFVTACGGGGGNSGGGSSSDSGSGGGSGSGSGSGGGTGQPQKTVEIEIWHTYSDQEEKVFNEQVIPKFEEQYPTIKVKSTRMPYDGLKQQVISAVAGGAAPDLMRMDIIWVPEFAEQGALQKLDGLPGFEEVKSQVFEGSLSTNVYADGGDIGYYGLPLNTNTKIAIYNKAALEKIGLSEPPKTMEELAAAARKAKDAGLKGGIGIGGNHAWGLLPYFWSLGGKLTDDSYNRVEGYLNSPESIKALETLNQWHKDGLIAPTLLGGEPGTWDGMKNDEYLMIDDGPWFYSILMNAGEERNVMDYTVRALIPAGDGGSRSVVGGENLVMFTGAKHPDEAWVFMKWLMGEEPQKLMASTGLIPTNVKAAQSPEVQEVPFVKEYVQQLETALPRTPNPKWAKMEEIFNLMTEKVFRGEAEPAAALSDAAKQIEAILNE